jgi:spore coat polysaccharide biosynthesis protein SpsF
MPVGTAVDVLDRQTLEKISDENAVHPVAPLREAGSSWNVYITDTEQWTQFSTTHTAIDTPADYWRLTDAVEAVGGDPYAVTSWLARRKDP